MKHIVYATALAAMLATGPLMASPAATAPILDQESDAGYSRAIGPYTLFTADGDRHEGTWAQTFTVGIDGLLTGIGLQIWNENTNTVQDLIVDLVETVGGKPIGDVLASITLGLDDVPTPEEARAQGFFLLDVSAFGIYVSAGDVLAVQLSAPYHGTPPSSPTVMSYDWMEHATNYAGGTLYSRTTVNGVAGEWYGSADLIDAGFRTFVDPDALGIPAPAPLFMLAMGLAAMSTLRRAP